jgi:hypothetical protein
LKHVCAVDERSLRLMFDQPLEIAKWDGTPGVKALGFRLADGGQTWTDADVLQTTVQGREVAVKFARPFSANALLWYGSGSDGQGQPTLRGAENHAPVRMIFSQRLTPSIPSRP